MHSGSGPASLPLLRGSGSPHRRCLPSFKPCDNYLEHPLRSLPSTGLVEGVAATSLDNARVEIMRPTAHFGHPAFRIFEKTVVSHIRVGLQMSAVIFEEFLGPGPLARGRV